MLRRPKHSKTEVVTPKEEEKHIQKRKNTRVICAFYGCETWSRVKGTTQLGKLVNW
jgi:hypothetical protein